MFSDMVIPDSNPERKSFRFRPKWISLFFAFAAALVPIGFWIAQGNELDEHKEEARGSDEHLVYLDKHELRLGAVVICPVLPGPRDQSPDLPDSVWYGSEIEPLKRRLISREDAKTGVLRLGATPSMSYSMIEAVLRTVRSAGVAGMELVDPNGSVAVALLDVSPICYDARIVEDCSPVADFGNEDSFSWFLERSDTLWFLASGQGRSIVRSVPWTGWGVDSAANSPVRDSVRRWMAWTTRGDSLDSVGIYFFPTNSFRKVFGIAKFIREATGKTTWIAEQPRKMSQYLSDFSAVANFKDAQRRDSATRSRGVSLAGLDRIYFRKHGEGSFLVSASREAETWMPLALDAKIVPPECDPECQDRGGFSHRDFPLPPVLVGHRLVLRQVQYRGVGMKTWPIWWALYDNGQRTSVWTFKGGLVRDKELTNYQIDKIVPLGQSGFRIRLKGESYRNGSWTEKGVELDFGQAENDFVLNSVGNRFGWFSGDEFHSEERSGDGWIQRKVSEPPKSLLRSCGYKDPGTEGAPEYDFDRNLRITRCITAWSKAKSTFRPAGEKSFIER